MRRMAIKIGAIFAGWTLLGTFWAVNRSLFRLTIGQTANFGEYLRLVLADYWLWALLTPAIFYLAQKISVHAPQLAAQQCRPFLRLYRLVHFS
jgi:hypothetical protein